MHSNITQTDRVEGTLGEHPEDVLAALAAWKGQSALVVVTNIVGGAVRAPGALMAVRANGASIGYVSGGCIDSDIIYQAQQTMAEGVARSLRYGQGSPFFDLPLPCGGAIDITIIPSPNSDLIAHLLRKLIAREKAVLSLDGDLSLGSPDFLAGSPTSTKYIFEYRPRLRLRIAGRGTDAIALARIASASGYQVHLQSTDKEILSATNQLSLTGSDLLKSVDGLPAIYDDPWTAFVLMFHDLEWEVSMLSQALDGPAFYTGAVGSKLTHERRSAALKQAGVSADRIEMIHGPIGVIPSLRDASMLAISTLAEIVQKYHELEY